MVRNRRTFLKVAGTAGVAAFAGCSGGDSEDGGDGGGGTTAPGGGTDTTTAAPSFPDPIELGYPSPSRALVHLAVFPGFTETIQEEYGARYNVNTYGSYTAMTAGFIKEEVHTGWLSMPALIQAAGEGLPIVAPMGFGHEHYSGQIVVSNDIDSWSDLEGKTVLVHDSGSFGLLAARIMAEEELGSSDAIDVEYVFGSSNRISQIEAGNADAAAVLLSAGYIAEQEGFGKILSYAWDYERLRNQPVQVWTVLLPNMEENEDTYREIFTTMQSGYEWVYETDNETVVDAALDTGEYDYGRDIMLRGVEDLKSREAWQAEIVPDELERMMDQMVQVGMIDEEDRVEPSQVIDDRFM